MADAPIDEQDFRGGVTVVDIGDIRVARGLSRRPYSSCNHRKLNYDPKERRIWCKDCEKDVDPFDAFESVAQQMHSSIQHLAKWESRLKQSEGFQARLLAAQEIEKAWRSKEMVPSCPCCHNGLFPSDFANGASSMIDKDFALKRRGKK